MSFWFGGFSSTTYPAGSNPWNAQLVQVAPNYTYFTPGIVPAAEELNYIFGNLSAAALAGVTVPGVGWLAQFDLSGAGYVLSGGAWDATNNQFLVCGSVSSGTSTTDVGGYNGVETTFVSVSDGSGVSLGGVAMSACNDGTYFYMAVRKASPTNAYVYQCLPGAAWGAAVYSETSSHYEQLVLLNHGGNVFLFGSSNTDGHVYISWEAAGTWNSKAFGFAQAGVLGVLVADSGSQIVAFPVVATPTRYAQSSTPTTAWTGESATFAGASGETAHGLTWSPADHAFVLVTYASDLKMRTYQSGDGINWTLMSTITPGTPPAGLAATSAGCLAMTLQNTTGLHSLLYSADGGVKWHKAAPGLTATTALTPNGVVSSGAQFFAFGTGGGRFSHASGFTPSLS